MAFGRGAKLEVVVAGDTRQLDRALGRAETRLQKFGKKTNALAGGAALSGRGGVGAAGSLLAGGGFALGAGFAAKKASDLAGAASDLNEEISKTNVVFESSSEAILQWSQTTASALGISRTEALKASGTFGSIFGNTGQTAAAAAELSKAVVTLGADLASFENTSTQDALDALRSGLSGEIEPLRRFKVFLTEAAVSQRAMADSGKKNVAQLTQGEKIMARYKLILEQTSKQQGDAVRTGDEFAGQQKRLRAEWADTRAELGQRLLPAMLKVTEAGIAVVKSFHGVEASVADLNSVDFRKTFADAFGLEELKRVIDQLGPELKALATQFQKDVQGIPLTVPVPKATGAAGGVPSFGQPGFKPGKSSIPVTQLSNRLVSEELDARLSGNTSTLKGVLAKEAEFLKSALDDVRLKPGQVVALKSALLGVTSEIQSIDDQIIADADEKAQAARDAREKIKAAHEKAVAALKKQAQAFKDQADDIKSAVLESFDSKQDKTQQARDLVDAKKSLRFARMIGAPEGIEAARRGLQDANFAIERQRIEDSAFRVKAGPPGPTSTFTGAGITININGAQDPKVIADQVIAAIRKRSKQTAGQSRGRFPGRID